MHVSRYLVGASHAGALVLPLDEDGAEARRGGVLSPERDHDCNSRSASRKARRISGMSALVSTKSPWTCS